METWMARNFRSVPQLEKRGPSRMSDKQPARGAVLWSWMVRLGLPDRVLYRLRRHFNHTDPGQIGLLYKVLITEGKLVREGIRLEVASKIKPSQE